MDALTLAELGRRARSDLALRALLDTPYAEALASLSTLSSFAAGQLLMLCPVLGARTLRWPTRTRTRGSTINAESRTAR